MYAVAVGPGVFNLNPISTLAVAKAANGTDLATIFANPSHLDTLNTNLQTAISQMDALLAPVYGPFGNETPTSYFINDLGYWARHSGPDLMFDVVSFAINSGTLTVANRTTNQVILSTGLGADFSTVQVTAGNIPTITNQNSGAVFAYTATPSIAKGGTAQFKSVVIGSALNQTVVWSVEEPNGGSISLGGVYTAPSTAGTYTVKAQSVVGYEQSFECQITVN